MKLESTEEMRARLLADEQVHSMIAMRAYEIYLLRGNAPGNAADDWFQAESEILRFVIDEEVRRRDAHSSHLESAAIERETPPFAFYPYDADEKRMEVFVSDETEAAPSAQQATLAASAGGGSKKAPAAVKSGLSEASTKGEKMAPKKAAARLKPPKVSAKKATVKVKPPKKAGKAKQSKQRSAETAKDK